MIIYNILFLSLLVLSSLNFYFDKKKIKNLINSMAFIILIFFSGSRINVGGDWHNYLVQFEGFSEMGFPSIAIFQSSDPFYILLNVISSELNFGLVGANFLCSIFFFSGIFFLLNRYNGFSFGILINFLFLVLILSMGFTRQSLSIGFIYFFLFFFIDKKNFLAFLCLLISLASHKTSIIFFVIFFSYIFIKNYLILNFSEFQTLIKSKKFWFFIVIIFALSFIFLFRDVERLVGVYIFPELELNSSLRQQKTSPGLIYKYPIFIMFAAIYYILRNRIVYNNTRERQVFDIYLLLIIIPLPFSGFFTLLVDRILIYSYVFISLLLCKLINQDSFSKKNKLFLFLIAVFFSFFILNYWLLYSNHSSFWLPYKSLYLNFN